MQTSSWWFAYDSIASQDLDLRFPVLRSAEHFPGTLPRTHRGTDTGSVSDTCLTALSLIGHTTNLESGYEAAILASSSHHRPSQRLC